MSTFTAEVYPVVLDDTRHVLDVDVGCTIADMVPAERHAIVIVNNRVLAPETYPLIEPIEGDYVVIRTVPTGVVVGAIAAVGAAGAGVAAATSVGFLGLSGFAAAAAWTAVSIGISVIGGLIQQSLIEPPKQPDGQDSPKRLPGITGQQNQVDPFGVIDKIYGTVRTVPKLGAKSYTEVAGDDQILRMLFVVGHGPLAFTEADIDLGDTPLTNYDDYDIEIRNGYADDEPVTLIKEVASEDNPNVPINEDGDQHVRTTAERTTRVSIDLVAQGLGERERDGTGTSRIMVPYVLEYREAGSENWQEPTISSTSGNVDLGARLGFPPYTFGTIGDTLDTVRFNVSFDVPEGQYDVRLTRGIRRKTDPTRSVDEDRDVSDMQWSAFRSFIANDGPVIQYPGPLALIALKIRATDQLNGVIDNLSVKVRSVIDVQGQGQIETANPAHLMPDVLRGNGAKTIVDLARIGDLSAFETFCAERNYAFNAVVSPGDRHSVLSQILSMGRGSIDMSDGRFGVVYEYAQQARQMFTPRNSWDFSGNRKYPKIPHALRTRYLDPTTWESNEVIVYRDGYNRTNATEFEPLDLSYGCADVDQAIQMAQEKLREIALRPEGFRLTTDIEYLVRGRGGRVKHAHDAILVGLGSARITAIEGDQVTFDQTYEMQAGADYGIEVRDSRSQIYAVPVETSPGENQTVTLKQSLPENIAVGDLVAFGEIESITQDLIIKSIDPDGDRNAVLELIPYAPEIYELGQPTPEYDANITKPIDPQRVPPVIPAITDVRTDQDVGKTTSSGSVITQIVVVYQLPSSNAPAVDRVQISYRKTDSQWQLLERAAGTSITIADVQEGSQYEIRARAISVHGVPSAYGPSSFINVPGVVPLPPTSVDVTANTLSVTLNPNGGSPSTVWEFYRSLTELQDIEANAEYIATTTALTDGKVEPNTLYFYHIRERNAYGVSEFLTIQVKTKNEFGPILTKEAGIIERSYLAQVMQDELTLITAPENVEGSVAWRDAQTKQALQGDTQATIENVEQAVETETEDRVTQYNAVSIASSVNLASVGTETPTVNEIVDIYAVDNLPLGGTISASYQGRETYGSRIRAFVRVERDDGHLDYFLDPDVDQSGPYITPTLESIPIPNNATAVRFQTRVTLGSDSQAETLTRRVMLNAGPVAKPYVAPGPALNQSGRILENNEVALSSEHGPFAEATRQVSVSDGDGEATIEQQFTAQRSDIGEFQSTYMIRLVGTDSDGNRYFGGWGLGAEGGVVTGILDLDKLLIGKLGKGGTNPFIFDTELERALLKEAMISRLIIGKLVSSTGEIVAEGDKILAKYIEAENLRVRQSLIVGAGALASTDTADWLTQVTGEGRPADYADVTSENTAADFKGRGALATTDTADWKTQITGQGRPNDIQYEARTLPGDGWYRIAVNGGNRAKARFILWDTQGNRHNQAEFTLSCNFNRKDYASFALLDSSRYARKCIDQIRLLTAGTYDTMYVDVHIINTNDSYTPQVQILDNVQSSGWTIGDLSAANIPDGYDVTTWDIDYDRVADNTGHNTADDVKTGGSRAVRQRGADRTDQNTAADFVGRGALARQNSADWASQIQGQGKPANNADVTGENRSLDTSRVNGRDAETVRLRADDVENWRRGNGQIRTDKVEYFGGETAEDLKPGEAGANVTENRTSNDVRTGSGRAVEESGANKTEDRTANDVRIGGGRAVAQSGADKTGSNTSADTARVDGEGSSSVLRKANEGRTAENRTAPWENSEGDMDEGRISREEGSITTIKRPRGGSYKTGNDATGAIRIRLPRPFNNSMIQFHVEVFQYQTNSSFTLMVSGYISAGGWRRTTAQLTGSTESNNGVRFAADSDNHPVIYIGDTDSFWDHAQIVVKDFQASFRNQRAGLWSSGWSVDLVTSFSGVQTIISDALIDAKAVRNQGAFATLDMIRRNNIAAYMESAAIERAFIKEAAVGTLEIEGEAVTVSDYVFSSANREYGTFDWEYGLAYTMNNEPVARALIPFSGKGMLTNGSGGGYIDVRLRIRKDSGNYTTWESVRVVETDGSDDQRSAASSLDVPFTVDGLTPNARYDFRVEIRVGGTLNTSYRAIGFAGLKK